LALVSASLVSACGGNVVLDGGSSGSGSGGSSASSAPGGSSFTCYVVTGAMQRCVSYENLLASAVMSVQSACTGENGTLGNACPTSGLLGSCTETGEGGFSTSTFFYEGSGFTAANAEMGCTDGGGTWTPGPG
jgi:hypothetical protein